MRLLSLNSRRLLMLLSRSEKVLIIGDESTVLSVYSYPLFTNVPTINMSPTPTTMNTGRFSHTALMLTSHRLNPRSVAMPQAPCWQTGSAGQVAIGARVSVYVCVCFGCKVRVSDGNCVSYPCWPQVPLISAYVRISSHGAKPNQRLHVDR